jgi:hypothetical protein
MKISISQLKKMAVLAEKHNRDNIDIYEIDHGHNTNSLVFYIEDSDGSVLLNGMISENGNVAT